MHLPQNIKLTFTKLIDLYYINNNKKISKNKFQ